MKKDEFKRRRSELLRKMEDNSILILFAGVGRKVSGDQFDHTVNRHFYYLTGIKQEDSRLVLVKTPFESHEYLFIEEKKPDVEKWTGYTLAMDEASEISGINNVLYISSFDGKLDALIESNPSHMSSIHIVYLDLEKELKIAESTTTHEYKATLEEKYAKYSLKTIDCYKLIARMRMIKSNEEIETIKEAIKTTDLALLNVLRNLRPGKYEYNMRNIFEFNVKDDANSTLAFDSIVASGANGVVLHYPNASDLIKDGDLVLFDVGAAHDLYCADISRTYPANGKFSQIQRMLYDIVLGCNRATQKFMRPGITLKECNGFAKNYLAEECYQKGLIAKKEDIDKVYYHGVTHHLGLDCHDAVSEYTLPLEEGNVITCEPGLYFKEYNIGIRIEDDILITKDGSTCLSSEIMKDPDQIEKILKSR